MSNYNTPSHDGEPMVTPLTIAISAVHHRNAHDLILDCLNNGMTHSEIAERLSTSVLSVSPSWVSWFIRQNFRKTVTWERAS